jgi:hypothetical protein
MNDNVDSVVRCDHCKHYRHTPSTLRRVCVGMFSDTFGHPAKYECLMFPQPQPVKPQHRCGHFTPNAGSHRQEGAGQ